MMDLDGNGVIAIEEMEQVFSGHEAHELHEMVLEILGENDVDNDGKISKEEF